MSLLSILEISMHYICWELYALRTERRRTQRVFFWPHLRLTVNIPPIFHNYGLFLAKNQRYRESIKQFDQALKLFPHFAPVYCDRGISQMEINLLNESLASHNTAVKLTPNIPRVYYSRANTLFRRGDLKRALQDYDKAIALDPKYPDAYCGRGNVFYNLKRYDVAFSTYDKALALKPDFENAWLGRGNVLTKLGRYDEAYLAHDKAFTLKPDLVGAEGARLHSKMHLCDWSNFDAECTRLILSIRNKRANSSPFVFLAIPSSIEDQLQCAELWASRKHSPYQNALWRGEQYRHDRIRIAYISSDFCQHATAFLAAGMFEYHDKSQFDVTAISIGFDDNSALRERLRRSFEHFVDADNLSDDEVASQIKDREIDLLIDLNGLTRNARTNVLARRPAPIQVNYLGYPGTMGASYIDYVIADQTLISEECKRFYSEKVVVLPNTYQANDRRRVISDKAFDRAGAGLPAQGFVFCCFNNNYKITPRVFNCWMRILTQVEHSVLWLLEDNASAAINLRKEAVARGVNAERLIFAKRIPPPEHLARHRLANLFLDTMPYNAHTTASDALWAELPVLTCIGGTFAGRVAASLLSAINLPRLITTTLEGYEQMAVELATHPEKLAAIKRKLAEHRLTTPLFDTKLFTRRIEAAYAAMYERYRAGLGPEHIVIPN